MIPPRAEIDYSLLDLINLFRRHFGWILWPVVLAAAATFIVVQFVLPPGYESYAAVLPAQSSEVVAKMPILERGAFRSAFRFGDVTTRNSINLELMVSDRVRRAVVRKLDLAGFFAAAPAGQQATAGAEQHAMDRLTKATRFGLPLQLQVLTVKVTTRDPAMSARIVQAYLAETNAANLERIHDHARQRWAFMDARLVELKAEIAKLQGGIAGYIETSGIADPGRELDIAYAHIRPLQDKLLDLQVQRDRLAQDQRAGSAERLALAAEIEVYERFLAGFDSLSAATGGTIATPRSSAVAGLERTRLNYELELLRALETSLIESRETARLEAILDVETLTILDPPSEPAKPIWPRKRLSVMMAGLLSLITASAVTFFVDALQRLGGGSTRAGLRQLLRET